MREKQFDKKYEARVANEAGDGLLESGFPDIAMLSYEKAAKLGSADAMDTLATIYSDKAEAAAEAGDEAAEEEAVNTANTWMMRAAAFGFQEAIEFLEDEYDPEWHDSFVDGVRAGTFEVAEPSDSTHATAAAAPAPTTYTAAYAPGHGGPGTNATTAYPDDVDATMASHLAGITFGGGSSGITS